MTSAADGAAIILEEFPVGVIVVVIVVVALLLLLLKNVSLLSLDAPLK